MSNTYTTKTITWDNGHSTLYAGTPMDATGKPVNDATAIGILAEDLNMPDRTAKILTAGTWDEDAHRDHGLILSDACKAAMSDITFTHPPVDMIDASELGAALIGYVKSTDLATTLGGYVEKTDLATSEAAGLVKMGTAIEDVSDAPTASEFNALLAALRAAGVLATPAETPAEEQAE